MNYSFCRICKTALVLGQPEISSLSPVSEALLDDFDQKKVTVPLLEGFIRCRDLGGLAKKPNRGSFARAERGEDCLVKRAFDCRKMQSIGVASECSSGERVVTCVQPR